jgi:methyl-accepting chemotaxis protein
MLIMGVYAYKKSKDVLEIEAKETLSSVRDIKGDSVTRYFENLRDQVITLSHSTMIQDAFLKFNGAFKNYSSDVGLSTADKIIQKSSLKNFYTNEFGAKYKTDNGQAVDEMNLLVQLDSNQMALQYKYISTNSHPLGSKHLLDIAEDGSTYSQVHAQYHPIIREFLVKYGLYDIFLVDIETGQIVYTVFKKLDFATSLVNGPYKDTNFAEAFRKAAEINDQESFSIVDYKTYVPSYSAPASFIGSPIWVNGKKVGVLLFQMPLDRINAVMGQRSGLGETGESYIFGADKLMRSDSYLDTKNFNVISSFKHPEKGTLNSFAVNEALSGKNGEVMTHNYLDQEVISTFKPINILGLNWGLVAEMSAHEAFTSAESLKKAMLIMVVISIVFTVLFSLFISIGLSKKIQVIADTLYENANEVASSSDTISTSSTHLSDAATQAASSLQETVSSIDEISSMVHRNADSSVNATKVSNLSNEAATRGKKTVESMIESIDDISKSNEMISLEIQKNNQDISKIVQVISEIGEKTKVINDIVFQTKLLSFNASVEAARAGEHGKGFAVVAEEVGNLAAMSGKAALEITQMLDNSTKQVTEIVENTKKKVGSLIGSSKEKMQMGTQTAKKCEESLDEILKNVIQVNEMVNEISLASNEQSIGVQEVTKAMQLLDQTTHKNTSVAQESSQMAKKLKEQAEGLNQGVIELKNLVAGSKE